MNGSQSNRFRTSAFEQLKGSVQKPWWKPNPTCARRRVHVTFAHQPRLQLPNVSQNAC